MIGGVFGLLKSTNISAPTSLAQVDSVTSEDHVKGNPNSEIILVEYSDFECPACAAYYPLLKDLLEEYGDSIKFVYRHFPLRQHIGAKPASYAAEAAGKQEKFWEMHDMIFENQGTWAATKNPEKFFLGYAQVLGLNLEQYEKDVASSAINSKVEKDYQSGLRAGVSSTPSLFLNGSRIQPRSYQEFRSFIDNANR